MERLERPISLKPKWLVHAPRDNIKADSNWPQFTPSQALHLSMSPSPRLRSLGISYAWPWLKRALAQRLKQLAAWPWLKTALARHLIEKKLDKELAVELGKVTCMKVFATLTYT